MKLMKLYHNRNCDNYKQVIETNIEIYTVPPYADSVVLYRQIYLFLYR